MQRTVRGNDHHARIPQGGFERRDQALLERPGQMRELRHRFARLERFAQSGNQVGQAIGL